MVRLKPDATHVVVALAAAFALASTAGCLPVSPPASPARPATAALQQLHRDLDAILADPALARGHWGVLVASLKSGETLYEQNARKLMIPASNMKIVTLAVAAERLGWDYTFETKLMTAGPIAGGSLDGDLVVVGNGDPSIGEIDRSGDRLFGDWIAALRAGGVRTVSGRIVGDDHAFDQTGLGFGWSWDDLPDDYAAAVSALQFNENAVRLSIAPGPSVGAYAGVSLSPAESGLTVDSVVKTTAAGTNASITAERLPGSDRLRIRGTVPRDAAPALRDVSVDNPTRFFVNSVRAALIAGGIDVRGPAVDVDDLVDPIPAAKLQLVATHRSPPLSTLALRLMKNSVNLYAETLLEAVGAAAGRASFASGRDQVVSIARQWGVEPRDLIVRDGSGLSRYDYVTPAALTAILTHIAQSDVLRGPFETSLPLAGRDGSLANRMKGTPADGNARAKTGSMSNVRSLSGYVTSAGGEPLVFSIIANNFDAAPSVINSAQDAIVVKLAAFRR